VLLVGRYDFASPQPWLQPGWWSKSVSLRAEQIAVRR
jgi:hypothetical protein